MKCIIAALKETEFKPRSKWWGYVDEKGLRHLMRYHHRFAVFQETPHRKVLLAKFETRTDKAGVEFAIRHYLSNPTSENQGMKSTFALIKPDAFPDGVTGIIIRIANAGFEIQRMEHIKNPPLEIVEGHLADLKVKNEKAYHRNVKSLTRGPVTALSLTFPENPEEVVESFRALVGPTDPADAAPGQIRKCSTDTLEKAGAEDRAIRNLIHASDSDESSEKEHKLWLP